MTSSLPELLDARGVATEVFPGMSSSQARASIDAIFRAVPNVVVPGLRKRFVRRADVRRLIDEGVRDWTDGKVA